MNKAEQFFRSMFASEADYLAFRLANKTIIDSISVMVDGQLEKEDLIRIVSKDNDKHHMVIDDKPSWIQHNRGRDYAVFHWLDGNHLTRLTREGGKAVKIAIDFGDFVSFTYEDDPDNDVEVDWEELFPESRTPDPEPCVLKSVIIDTEIKNWSFLNLTRRELEIGAFRVSLQR